MLYYWFGTVLTLVLMAFLPEKDHSAFDGFLVLFWPVGIIWVIYRLLTPRVE